MKNHYTQMLRSAAQGGFMCSAQKLMEAKGKVRSIMEYDLLSAYGFSASHVLMPSGYCTGFLCLESGGTGETLPLLEKADLVKRHKTFEFKAVYFTLQHSNSV